MRNYRPVSSCRSSGNKDQVIFTQKYQLAGIPCEFFFYHNQNSLQKFSIFCGKQIQLTHIFRALQKGEFSKNITFGLSEGNQQTKKHRLFTQKSLPISLYIISSYPLSKAVSSHALFLVTINNSSLKFDCVSVVCRSNSIYFVISDRIT